MARATSTDLSAYQSDQGNAQQELGSANSGLDDYMSNVNAQLSAGNPYESKDYLTKQNLTTSGAMNSEKDAEDQQLGDTVARTGTNSAALANTEAESARQGERDLTDYNAARDTANEHAWQGEKDQLTRDQLAGAEGYGNLYATQQGAANSALSNYTTAQDAQDEMWAQMAGAAAQGAGTGAGLAAACWVAAELWGGWEDPRVKLMRRWLSVSFGKHWYGAVPVALYARHGESWARWIRKSRVLRWAFSAIFERGLRAAQRWSKKYGCGA